MSEKDSPPTHEHTSLTSSRNPSSESPPQSPTIQLIPESSLQPQASSSQTSSPPQRSSPPTTSAQSSPPTSPPPQMTKRRSSLVPADADVIAISKRGKSGTRSPRRGSQAFLMGDDTIIMQFNDGRRLSSFCTTSSNDETAISMGDEPMTEDEISETIKAHKQIISNMKSQHWPMHRKLKVLRRAKLYIQRHEGELKQSKQAKDVVAKYRVYLEKTINRFKREFANFIVVITPWEMRIKKIESHFGSVVASYFIFLRWVFWVNIFISVFICCFLMVPEVLRGDKDLTGMRKEGAEDDESSLRLQTIWDFEGYLKYSPIFYGYYSNRESTSEGYRLPLAYFLTSFLLYMFSFFCILRKMAQNARMSRISTKDDECTFCWKLFTGWDYMIGNSETAYNKVASLVMGFKESILEEKEKKKEERNWKKISKRILANLLVLMLLGSSAYGVVLVVERSQQLPDNASWIRNNEVTLVVSGIGIVYPNIFDFLGMMEEYHPRIALRWQLGRILILQFINLYTLMFSLFGKVDTMTSELEQMKINISTNVLTQMNTSSLLSVIKTVPVYPKSGRTLLEGRDYEEEDEDRDYETVPIHIPSIINDPYGQKAQRKKWDSEHIEGRQTEEPEISSTTEIDLFTESDDSGGGFHDTTTSVTYDLSNDDSTSTVRSESTTIYPSLSKLTTMTTTTMRSTHKRTRFTTTAKTTTTEFATTTTATVITDPTTEKYVLNDCEAKKFQIYRDNYVITTDDMINQIRLNTTDRDKLQKLCWETMFGQELVKLTIMDLILTVISTIIGDFIRALIVRYCNDCQCIFWDLEKKFPGYGDFKIAENILHLVNNQGMVWLGMFFSPGLPAINTIKLCLLMYVRSWAVLTCNIPHETVFKASRSNNFYFGLLLIMLFLCTLPVGYATVWIEPSWHCGPFSGHFRIYHILTHYIESKLPKTINAVIDYLTSPGAIIPLLLLLILIIYYLISLVGSLKLSNKELKGQIRKEKDVSEVGPSGPIIPEGVIISAPEKKHVRIQEEVMTDSDKAKLLQKTNSVESSN